MKTKGTTGLHFSRIYELSDSDFSNEVAHCISIRELSRRLGFVQASGGTYQTIKKRIKDLNLSTDHFLGQAFLRGKSHDWTAGMPDEAVFIEHSTYKSNAGLKKKLIRDGVEEKCAVCGIGPSWQSKPLSLQIDHINGISDDHRKENLRLLCPNCHSQTETWGARRTKQRPDGMTVHQWRKSKRGDYWKKQR